MARPEEAAAVAVQVEAAPLAVLEARALQLLAASSATD
jgi:hypothetical protein